MMNKGRLRGNRATILCALFLLLTPAAGLARPRTVSVVTKEFHPLVMRKGDAYAGFSVDLWAEIARRAGIQYEIHCVRTIEELLDEIRNGKSAVGFAGISVTANREREIDFSHPYFESGLQIMVASRAFSPLTNFIPSLLLVISANARSFFMIALAIFITVTVAAHMIWYFERHHNPDFPHTYLKGIWEALWWSSVTITAVGYGDKTLKGFWGRLFGILWMFAGVFLLAYLTAIVTTHLTLTEIRGAINGPGDLFGRRVGAVSGTTSARYLADEKIPAVALPSFEEAAAALSEGRLDAVVYDSPVLKYYAANKGKGRVRVVGPILRKESYAFALPKGNSLREEINQALLQIIEDGSYEKINAKWFGH